MKKLSLQGRKGFTLIELLVVIAIIAILAVVVVLTLNPAQLLEQSRDSNRISDMQTLKSALSLYVADQTSPNLASTSLAYTYVYTSYPSGTVTQAGWGIKTISNSTTTSGGPTGTPTRAVDATGWIPVNLNAISSGAPVGSLPVDPVNNSTLFYAYVATSTNMTFKVTSHMESTKYSTGGTNDIETGDGGVSSSTYEVGTGLSL